MCTVCQFVRHSIKQFLWGTYDVTDVFSYLVVTSQNRNAQELILSPKWSSAQQKIKGLAKVAYTNYYYDLSLQWQLVGPQCFLSLYAFSYESVSIRV